MSDRKWNYYAANDSFPWQGPQNMGTDTNNTRRTAFAPERSMVAEFTLLTLKITSPPSQPLPLSHSMVYIVLNTYFHFARPRPLSLCCHTHLHFATTPTVTVLMTHPFSLCWPLVALRRTKSAWRIRDTPVGEHVLILWSKLPTIQCVWLWHVHVLHIKLNKSGWPTKYMFQYGSTLT